MTKAQFAASDRAGECGGVVKSWEESGDAQQRNARWSGCMLVWQMRQVRVDWPEHVRPPASVLRRPPLQTVEKLKRY